MAKLEIWRFKKTGKYYDTIYLEFKETDEIPVSLDAFDFIKEAQAKDTEFIYVFTGNGLDNGFPKIFDIDRTIAVNLLR